MAPGMNNTEIWDIEPCSFAEVDRRFRGAFASITRKVTWRYFPEGCHFHSMSHDSDQLINAV
jgi:hypothetical protein